MTLGLFFWICMLVWLALSLYFAWPKLSGVAPGLGLQFLLFAVLGWAQFGPPIKV